MGQIDTELARQIGRREALFAAAIGIALTVCAVTLLSTIDGPFFYPNLTERLGWAGVAAVSICFAGFSWLLGGGIGVLTITRHYEPFGPAVAWALGSFSATIGAFSVYALATHIITDVQFDLENLGVMAVALGYTFLLVSSIPLIVAATIFVLRLKRHIAQSEAVAAS